MIATPLPPKGSRRSPRRLYFLIGLAIVLSLGALGYRYFWLYHPMGSGPAGPAVPRERFAKPWSERDVLLLGLGDSVTAGFGASAGHSYFDRLKQNPWGEFPDLSGISLSAVLPKLKSVNRAISGFTSMECLDHAIPKLKTQPASTFGVVVLTIGGNDVIHLYGRAPPRECAMYGASFEEAEPWIANFETRLNTILDKVVQRFPGGCRIFMANIYDPTDGVGDIQNAGLPAWPDGLKVLTAYNEVIARVAEARPEVLLVDMHGVFLGHGIHSVKFTNRHYHRNDPGYWYYDNLEDPNDRGYDALRRVFLIEMSKELPQALQGR